MPDATYFAGRAERCRELLKAARVPEVIEQLRYGRRSSRRRLKTAPNASSTSAAAHQCFASAPEPDLEKSASRQARPSRRLALTLPESDRTACGFPQAAPPS